MAMRILMTAGGTGGTIFPLVATADALRRLYSGSSVSFIVSKRPFERTLVERAGYPATTFSGGKWRRYVDVKNIIDLFRIAASFVRALFFLRRVRPDVVVSAGSFVSVPIVWAARLLGIPALIHQQDVALGLANKLMLRAASVMTIALEGTGVTPKKGLRTVVTGNPVREAVVDSDPDRARARFALSKDLPLLVVLGGSSGAKYIGELMTQTASELSRHVQIIYVAGRNGVTTPTVHERFQTVAFLEEGLGDLLAAADLVVTRAGLSTLSEIVAIKTPTIVIPMPGTHQEVNAKYYAGRHAVIALDQSSITPKTFVGHVNEILGNHALRRSLSKNLERLARPDAAIRIAQEIAKLANTHGAT